jgi:Fe-S cluster biosynthesis and repair protein YggX
MVHCIKLGREAEGVTEQMVGKLVQGELREKVLAGVSKDAWIMWREHSKMLINEYRLDLMSDTAQKIWLTELEKYFFGEGSAAPAEFVPEKGH